MTVMAGSVGADTTAPETRAANFVDALRSEWTKARSVPSTLWTLAVAAVLGVGLGALISTLAAHRYAKNSLTSRASWDPTSISGAGLSIAQLAIGVLGILLITSEYSTREIASSLTAVPRRARMLAAKITVVLGLTFTASTAIAFAAFFIGQAVISGHAPTAGLGQSHVLRALIGCGLYGALIGLLGLALGTLLRNAAAAVAVLVALLFVLPVIALALPMSLEQTVEKFWPSQAGQQITLVVRKAHTISAWAGLGVFILFVAILLSLASIALNRRDA